MTDTSAVIPAPEGGHQASPLTIVDIDGVGEQAGRSYGEACRPLIRQHLEAVVSRGRRTRDLTLEEMLAAAAPYREAVSKAFPRLAAEIDGVAAGAGIPVGAAWLLQLRAEVLRFDLADQPAECTSFGAGASVTHDGRVIAGQNGDLPAFYQDVLVLVRRTQPDRPRVLTLTPAGQVGWHGMNEFGVAVFANFLHTPGWRVGIPRYLFTRIAMEARTASEAIDRLVGLHRGSTRNVLIADGDSVSDIELGIDSVGRIEGGKGFVTHANHALSHLSAEEQTTPEYLSNSRIRQERMEELLQEKLGSLDVPGAAEILRDRVCAPDALSRIVEDALPRTADDGGNHDTITVASTIADVQARQLWIAIGPPHKTSYHPYSV